MVYRNFRFLVALDSPQCEFQKRWASINNKIELQHTQIQASFYKNMILMEHQFKGNVLSLKLVRKISRNTMHFITDQADRGLSCGMNKSQVIKVTCKFPSASTIAKKIKLGALMSKIASVRFYRSSKKRVSFQ